MNSTSIECRSGLLFDFLNIRRSNVLIDDIAHSLSMQCRFNGHTERFYSVAEHCVHCSNLAPPELALQALVHDAAEAYIGDVAKPLKNLLSDYQRIEQEVEEYLFEYLHVSYPFDPAIKKIDQHMLKVEQGQAMVSRHHSNGGITELPVPVLEFWDPKEAEKQFLLRYMDLVIPS